MTFEGGSQEIISAFEQAEATLKNQAQLLGIYRSALDDAGFSEDVRDDLIMQMHSVLPNLVMQIHQAAMFIQNNPPEEREEEEGVEEEDDE